MCGITSETKSYLLHRTHCVKIGGNKSKPAPIKCGVPLLFLVYINIKHKPGSEHDKNIRQEYQKTRSKS